MGSSYLQPQPQAGVLLAASEVQRESSELVAKAGDQGIVTEPCDGNGNITVLFDRRGSTQVNGVPRSWVELGEPQPSNIVLVC